MWYVISADGVSVVSIAASHTDAIRQAHHLATLRAKLVAGPTLRYTVRKS